MFPNFFAYFNYPRSTPKDANSPAPSGNRQNNLANTTARRTLKPGGDLGVLDGILAKEGARAFGCNTEAPHWI
jgi:hypothetical protein